MLKIKNNLIILVINNIVGIILSIVIPILSAKIIISLTSNNYSQIILIALVIFIVDGISNLTHYISRVFSIKIYRNTLSALEIDLGRNVLKLENECLDENGSGLFIQRLTNDTARMADVFNSLLDMISNLIRSIGILTAIFVINKFVFIYILLTLIILYVIEKKRTNRKNKDDKTSRKASEKVSGFVGELVRGSRDIKMLNSEEDFVSELQIRINDFHNKRMKMEKYHGLTD